MDNRRCKEGEISMLVFKRIIQKVKEWLNKNDVPRYLSGKK